MRGTNYGLRCLCRLLRSWTRALHVDLEAGARGHIPSVELCAMTLQLDMSLPGSNGDRACRHDALRRPVLTQSFRRVAHANIFMEALGTPNQASRITTASTNLS